MFDLDELVAACTVAVRDPDPRGAVRDVVARTLERREDLVTALGRNDAGLDVMYVSPELTILNVVWAPRMTIFPHDHRMAATIGVYGGAEANTLYRRGRERIARAGERTLEAGDVFSLGPDAIHSVANPLGRFTGAIHVYGGDFVTQPRSQWDPDTMREVPYELTELRRRFAEANEEWRAQLGQDLDEEFT
jgi:predicted metal-dependent enzyme (double-stranded beta helix superfamily)